MGADTCPYCDKCLTRAALLALRLRKVSAQTHDRLGHPGPWQTCRKDPCQKSAEVLNQVLAGDV